MRTEAGLFGLPMLENNKVIHGVLPVYIVTKKNVIK